MLTDHGLCTSLRRGLKIEKNRSFWFSGRLSGAGKARVALDFGAQRVGAGTFPEAVTNRKAACLQGRLGGEATCSPCLGSSPSGTCKLTTGGQSGDSAFKEGETARGSLKRTKGEGKELRPQ